MSDYELSIPSIGTFIFIGTAFVIALFFLWQKMKKPRLEPDRRQLKMKVEVERRKGDRRKYPRYQYT
jgi:hypothetical protein